MLYVRRSLRRLARSKSSQSSSPSSYSVEVVVEVETEPGGEGSSRLKAAWWIQTYQMCCWLRWRAKLLMLVSRGLDWTWETDETPRACMLGW